MDAGLKRWQLATLAIFYKNVSVHEEMYNNYGSFNRSHSKKKSSRKDMSLECASLPASLHHCLYKNINDSKLSRLLLEEIQTAQ